MTYLLGLRMLQKHKALVGVAVFVVLPALFLGFHTNGQGLTPQLDQPNSQTLAILSVSGRASLTKGSGGGDIRTENGALVPYTGPQGTSADEVFVPSADQISLYVVQEGDTISHIAELFGVSANTVRWANDMNAKSTIRPGQILTILPISSVQHKVAKGETLASIVKKYDGDLYETALFNGIDEKAKLNAGDTILIPDGVLGQTEIKKEPQSSSSSSAKKTNSAPSSNASTSSSSKDSSYFVRAWGGVRTQGFHGAFRAVDYGLPVGSNIGASASGTVIAAKSPNAWNGGYGGMVVIKHDNGAQTLYAHLSRLDVSVGQRVSQRETIGLSGNTGRSTGPHLHFEIRGWGDIPF